MELLEHERGNGHLDDEKRRIERLEQASKLGITVAELDNLDYVQRRVIELVRRRSE